MRRNLLCLMLMFSFVGMSAQTMSETWVTSDTLQVYFPQNVSVLDPGFRGNGEKLEAFTENFHKMKDTQGVRSRVCLLSPVRLRKAILI